jgi:hypothetical protein
MLEFKTAEVVNLNLTQACFNDKMTQGQIL